MTGPRIAPTEPGVEIEARARGLERVVTARTITAECSVCGREFSSTGAAASHAGASRHPVEAWYSARFTYRPATDDDGLEP